MALLSVAKCFAGYLALRTAFGNPVSGVRSYPAGHASPPILKEGQLGAVASEAEICSHIGIDLLKAGGNAADALVGTVACVGVVGMYHSGRTQTHDIEPQSKRLLIITRTRRWRIYACQGTEWNI